MNWAKAARPFCGFRPLLHAGLIIIAYFQQFQSG
jgi:hypothetical protein